MNTEYLDAREAISLEILFKSIDGVFEITARFDPNVFCGLGFVILKYFLFVQSLFLVSLAHGTYEPRVGDLYFQSLPRNAVIDAIEGASESPYSHCGILVRKGGGWFVLEAIGPVRETPLAKWIKQARDRHYDVFRLREKHEVHIPEYIKAARKYLGRPYDIRYRMDDEKIYCSELIFKSYRDATGEQLGKLVKFGDLKWGRHVPIIIAIEGSIPVNRIMITPRHLSEAKQLEFIYSSKKK
jgi:hypothetical protein